MENIPDIKSFLRDVKGKRQQDADPSSLRSEVQDPHAMHDEVDLGSSIPLDKPSELLGRRFFIETYGCQMNESDSEIVHAVLEGAGLVAAKAPEDASVILINTCAVCPPLRIPAPRREPSRLVSATICVHRHRARK